MTEQLSVILWLSVLLQIIAVILALRLIPISGRGLAWSLLSAAFLLMATRRAISLLHQRGDIQSEVLHAFTAESVALLISALLVVGVFLIRNIFVSREQAHQQIRKLSLAVEQNPSSTMIFDINGNVEYANPCFYQVHNIKPEMLIGKNLAALETSHPNSNIYTKMQLALQSGTHWKGEVYIDATTGNRRWESANISPLVDNNRKTTHYVATFQDITKAKSHSKVLEQLALHDSLTGLPNRNLFNDRLQQEIIKAERDNTYLAVLMMDLDRFKEINDTLGHRIGDLLLMDIGPRLQQVLRKGDTVARMGGDEFLILLPMSDNEHSEQIAKKIQDVMETPFKVDNYHLDVGISIGISTFPEHGTDPESLLQHADIAMYAAKKDKIGHAVYSPDFDPHSVDRLELASELRHAVERRELTVLYHPKIDTKTQHCSGFEALVRWAHPEKGIISPDQFIHLAEHTGHIKYITQHVLQLALLEWTCWQEAGHDLDVSVNISARDFLDDNFAEMIQDMLQSTGARADALVLELTESVLMTDISTALKTLSQLDQMGVRLSIDDFGTGYSSLEYLKKFPVDELKIDKSFVMNMMEEENDAVIVRSTIDLAHNLGLNVVAEGVEDEFTGELLHVLQCDTLQGYYYSHPLLAEQIPELLRNQPWKMPN